MNGFYHLLSRFFSLKVRRYLPPKKTFELLHTTGNGRLFVTKHKNKVIGGSCCVYSGNNVYLWYMASKRKSHPTLHPSVNTTSGISISWMWDYLSKRTDIATSS